MHHNRLCYSDHVHVIEYYFAKASKVNILDLPITCRQTIIISDNICSVYTCD